MTEWVLDGFRLVPASEVVTRQKEVGADDYWREHGVDLSYWYWRVEWPPCQAPPVLQRALEPPEIPWWEDGRPDPLWNCLWPARERTAPPSVNVIDDGPANRRGPAPDLRVRIEEQMSADIKNGVITAATLARMKQESLAMQYGAKSRSTVVQARDSVLEQLRQNSDKLRPTTNGDMH